MGSANQQLKEYLEGSRDRELSDWLWGLRAFGRETVCRAALAAATACLDIWQRGVPDAEGWWRYSSSAELARSTIEAAMRHLETRSDPGEVFRADVKALRKLVEQAHFYAEEGSGSAERGAMFDRAAAVGSAIAEALEGVVFDSDRATAGVPDEAERQAIIDAGPTANAWHAVRAFMFARSASPDEARQLITSALLGMNEPD
jgi:hypothetical protein